MTVPTTSGTDLARRHPVTAARVVVIAHEGGGDALNAWQVLASAFGGDVAGELLCLVPGGTDALAWLHAHHRVDLAAPAHASSTVFGPWS